MCFDKWDFARTRKKSWSGQRRVHPRGRRGEIAEKMASDWRNPQCSSTPNSTRVVGLGLALGLHSISAERDRARGCSRTVAMEKQFWNVQ